ncbi:MAG TPA: type II toxin-antitoxin system Phd/YefM family antitoxin [Candidatus Nitrosotalea sp.]|nr:type II toxin-antitoxin system Phd/YefM family antitoxin [Candidatus Nitrosotalea sp.]
MKSVNVHEAKTHFSALLKKVEAGEEIVIAKAGRPIARLVPAQEPQRRQLGWDLGAKVWIADDFDEYIPEEWREYIE